MVKMTIRKANYERKRKDDEIFNKFRAYMDNKDHFMFFLKATRPMIGNKTKEQLENDCKSSWDSLINSIQAREKYNDSVMHVYGGFNPETSITIPLKNVFTDREEKVSIAVAIAKKSYYSKLSGLFKDLDRLSNSIISAFEKRQSQLYNELKQQVNAQFSSSSTASSKERVVYEEMIKKDYEIILCDPLNIKEILSKIIAGLDDTVANIDSYISNATELNEVELDV